MYVCEFYWVYGTSLRDHPRDDKVSITISFVFETPTRIVMFGEI